MTDTPMPVWLQVLLVIAVPTVAVGVPALWFLYAVVKAKESPLQLLRQLRHRLSGPAHVVEGIKIYVDLELKGKLDTNKLRSYLRTWIGEMSGPGPGHFSARELEAHLKTVVCNFRNYLLDSPQREAGLEEVYEKFSGLTHSENEIEVSGMSSFQDSKGNIDLLETPFFYELLNVCIWKFEGYEVSYAEVFLDPENKSYLKWISDVDQDGDVDSKDLELLKEKRKPYDEAHQKAMEKIRQST